MDANDPERGGGITEQAHIKLFRTHTSEGPELQKGLAPLAANPPNTLNQPLAPFTRSPFQGDFDIFEKVYEGKRCQQIVQIPICLF